MLSYVSTFGGGILSITNVGAGNDTAVLKADPLTGEILLDPNNSGNFVDTGANLKSTAANAITGSIQISAGNASNSTFIIDNNAGAFFQPTAFFPTFNPKAPMPTVVFNGGSGLNAINNSLTVKGKAGVADSFEIDNATFGSSQLTLTEPPTSSNQQFFDQLLVQVNNLTGSLNMDGIDGQNGNDSLLINATKKDLWQFDGNVIQGPFAFGGFGGGGGGGFNFGDFTIANLSSVQIFAPLSGDAKNPTTVTIDQTAASTSVFGGDLDVVNHNQPLAFPVQFSDFDTSGKPVGELDVNGTAGPDNMYISDSTIAFDANTSEHIQPPASSATQSGQEPIPQFTHAGADVSYAGFTNIDMAGEGGNDLFTLQVPPTFNPPFLSPYIPGIAFFGGNNPHTANVAAGTTLLRVFGNNPQPNSAGEDTIILADYAGVPSGGASGNNIFMYSISAAVVYGLNGNKTITNNSAGNKALGIPPVPALLIGGNGDDTLTGGAGNDMLLGGGTGNKTLISKAVSTQQKPTTTYFFPHQDQNGTIYDPLLDPSVGDTTSTLTGAGGNQIVVTGDVPALTAQTLGDMDTGNLAYTLKGGAGGANANGGQTIQIPTVPPQNVTASLYEATPALIALEQALGESSSQFPPNIAAELEFGTTRNLRGQFATYAAFVGRAYNDFMIDRGGTGQVGQGAVGGATVGASIVTQPEIQYWVQQGQQGLTVQQMQAHLLASDELRQSLPGSASYVRFLFEAIDGREPTNDELTAYYNQLVNNDTAVGRYSMALQFLSTPEAIDSQINEMYQNFFSTGISPTPSDAQAIQTDISAGEPLTQVAQTIVASNGNYLNYSVQTGAGVIGSIGELYQLILHRSGSVGELNYWAGQRAAGVSQADVALRILNSPEARAHTIANDYQTYLGRPVDPAGLNYWESVMAMGVTDEQVLSSIIASPEYYLKSGGTSDGYVRALYRDILHRTSPPAQFEVDYWIAQLAASNRGEVQARADIALQFQQSTEYRADLISQWYQQYLGRAPSAAELSANLQSFVLGATDEAIEANILASR